MKPFIDKILQEVSNGWTGISVIAAYTDPCFPSKCCRNGRCLAALALCMPFVPMNTSYVSFSFCWALLLTASTGKFNHLLNGCIKAPRGYQSDHFIFSIAQGRTYMITVPLITSASLGNSSTLHQDHVNMHHGAFNRINNCINDMRGGKAPFPNFVNTNCTY